MLFPLRPGQKPGMGNPTFCQIWEHRVLFLEEQTWHLAPGWFQPAWSALLPSLPLLPLKPETYAEEVMSPWGGAQSALGSP